MQLELVKVIENMPSQVTKRFITCFQELLSNKTIRSARHFAEEVNTYPQALNEILKERRDVSHEILEVAIAKYHINANFLYSGKGPHFIKETDFGKEFKILTIVENHQNKEKLLHVPISAHAGYSLQQNNPNFIKELEAYNLPDFKFKSDQTMRSFEVKGQSMIPVFLDGDVVICNYIHSYQWEKAIQENKFYVVVTKSGVVLKRIGLRLREESCLLMHSENEEFQSYRISASEVIELWEVKARITSQFKYDSKANSNFDRLESRFNKYEMMLEEIVQKMILNNKE